MTNKSDPTVTITLQGKEIQIPRSQFNTLIANARSNILYNSLGSKKTESEKQALETIGLLFRFFLTS